MSLILCRQESVQTPYYIEELNIHIYSSQELCYVIYNNPLLVMEDFVDERLLTFLRSELKMPFLAERLSKWIAGHGLSDELLLIILQDCTYYNQQELIRFKQELAAFRKLPEEEYKKKRADYFYGLGLYGRSRTIYEKILDSNFRNRFTPDFKSSLWNNIAACHAKLFCYPQALRAYECAWREKQDTEYLKRMYLLTKADPELSLKDEFSEHIEEEQKLAWDKEEDDIRKEAGYSKRMTALAQIFEKEPSERLNGAADVLNQWKASYRKML